MPHVLKHDGVLCSVVVGLTFFGLVMVLSATTGTPYGQPADFSRQCFAAALGLVVMAVLMHVDYRLFNRPGVVFLVLSGAVALLTVVLFAASVQNTHRFLRVFGFGFQPSEFAKISLILFLAFYLDKYRDRINEWRTLAGAALITSVLFALVLAGKDLGTSVALLLIAATVLWTANLEWRFFGYAAAVVVPVIGVAILLQPYRIKRLLIFLDPESEPTEGGFQIIQSLISVGSGGIAGVGLMESKQKMLFLPAAHTDFIFAVICEELGLLGALGVLVAFAALLWRGLRAARLAPDGFGRYLAAGVTAMIVWQAMINIGVVLAMLPTKGLPLPYVSYGGTALIMVLMASGVLLSVSRHAQPE